MYELVVLNDKLESLVTFDDFESLIWVRKYYEAGNFELHCSAEYFADLKKGKYLYCADLPELGVIRSVQYEKEGEKSVATGLFAECLLSDHVITDVDTGARTPEAWTRLWIERYFIAPTEPARKLTGLALGSALGIGNAVTADDVRGEDVLTAACAMLKSDELGLCVRYDTLNNAFTAKVWTGVDRTAGQAAHSLAVFATDDETVSTESYRWDDSNYKNFAYVTNGDEAAEVVVSVDKTQGAPRRELWISASVNRESGESDASYKIRLQQQGQLELGKHDAEETVSTGVPTSDTLIYGVDYDLGDKVTYQDAAHEICFDARVEGVTVTVEGGSLTVFPTLGNDKYM